MGETINMNISVLSGKGGTGKTTVSTNLAALLNEKGYKTQYLDFDVEEPNGFIFLKPQVNQTISVNVKVPQINEELCDNCGDCARNCNFNAIGATKDKVLLFEKLCHSCGVCSLVCTKNAIDEVEREIGFIETGNSNGLDSIRGVLNIGEPMGVPILKQLRKHIKPDYINIIDSPPGSSCSVVNSIEKSDYSVLVTEPTPFGLHDLKIAVDVVRHMGIRFGVIINKSSERDGLIENYCDSENINIIGKVPFDKGIAMKYSKGQLLIEDDKLKGILDSIITRIMEGVK